MDDSDGDTYYGVLFTTKNSEDGIFVMETPFKREVAYVPYARYYLEKEQYPALSEYCRRMTKTVAEQVARALKNQEDGRYQIRMRALCNNEDGFHLDEDLFLAMMKDHEEFEYAEDGWDDEEDIVFLGISRDFVKLEDESKLRPISQIDFEIACARHTLWLNNAGGKQADFSNCLLRGLDLTRKNLQNAIFDNAKIIDCTVSGSDWSNSSFVGCRFTSSELLSFTAISSDFTDARFALMDLSGCNFETSKFTNAVFLGCGLYNVNLDNCCLDNTDLTEATLVGSNTAECFDDEQRWSNYLNNLGGQTQGGLT